jgi:hypothetical protein
MCRILVISLIALYELYFGHYYLSYSIYVCLPVTRAFRVLFKNVLSMPNSTIISHSKKYGMNVNSTRYRNAQPSAQARSQGAKAVVTPPVSVL